MFRILYSIATRIFGFVILVVSPFNDKARKWVRGRRRLWERLSTEMDDKQPVAWFHCASLGEFEQGRPVIEAYRKAMPGNKIMLTFFSPSGYDIRKNYEGADWVFYLPLDLKWNVKKFLNLTHPHLAVFVKYEFWYEYLFQMWQRKIPVFLISAHFRSQQWFFQWYGKPFRRMLNFFTHFFVQDEFSGKLLKKHGFENITVAGDTRFDRVFQIAQTVSENKLAASFKQDTRVVVAGSTWPGDEQLLIRYINQTGNHVKWILAPHEVHSSHLQQIESLLKVPYQKYSEALETLLPESRVLIIDNVGILSGLYKYGEMAYVGGGFGSGIHNILEPATFGIPVVFGPSFSKFQEAIDLIKLEAAFPVGSYEELMNIFDFMLDDPTRPELSGKTAKKYIKNKLGATKTIVDNLLNV